MVKLKLSNVHLVDTFGAVSTVEARPVEDEDNFVTVLEVESCFVEDEDSLVTVLEL